MCYIEDYQAAQSSLGCSIAAVPTGRQSPLGSCHPSAFSNSTLIQRFEARIKGWASDVYAEISQVTLNIAGSCPMLRVSWLL
ncbi:hypothetical protein M5689_007997 [Euphorbia peplus]|nr:hypothetical protein M5689_007997 [Euphorbia peplus]